MRFVWMFAAFVHLPGLALAGPFELYGSHASGDARTWGLTKLHTDPITGESDRIGAGGLMFEFDFDAKGTLHSSDGDALFTVDVATGLRQRIGSFGISPRIITSLAVAPWGMLYGTDNSGLETRLYVIDTQTGRATSMGTVGNYVFGIDFDPAGTLYGASGDIFEIDLETGAMGAIVVPYQGVFATSLDWGADGVFRTLDEGFAHNDSLYEVDLEGARLSFVALTDEADMYGLASIPAAPTLALPALAMALSRRRR